MEEIKKLIEELKRELGKNTEAVAKVAVIEQTLARSDADMKKLRIDLEQVKQDNIEREKKIEEFKRESRIQGMQRDGIMDRTQALTMLGMLGRQALAIHIRSEVPSAFKHEDELVRAYIKRATLNEGAVTGSYLVPTFTMSEIIDAMEEVSGILSLTDFVVGLPAGSSIYWPVVTGRSTLQPARATVDTAASESGPTFGQLELTPKEAYIFFPVTNRLLQMSAIALGTLLNQNLRDNMLVGMVNWLIVADGTSSYNSITGMLAQSTAAYIKALPAGKTAFADLTKADLTATKAKALKRGRGQRGRWVMSQDVFGLIEDMDRTGKTPVVTEMPDGSKKVLGNLVEIEEDMPDLVDSVKDKGFIGFGDPATWLIGLVGNMEFGMSDQVRFDKVQTCFRGVMNMAMERKPMASFITLKTAAA